MGSWSDNTSGLSPADVQAMNDAGVTYVDSNVPITPQEQSLMFPNYTGPGMDPGAYTSSDSPTMNQPSSLASVGGGVGSIMKALGGLGSALGPALLAAGKIAQESLNRPPYYRPIPSISAPSPDTRGGVTQPLKLGGAVVQNDPITNYVKLMQGMR